jgi:hypothetical protein
MLLRHAIVLKNLPSIQRHGLLCRKSRGLAASPVRIELGRHPHELCCSLEQRATLAATKRIVCKSFNLTHLIPRHNIRVESFAKK